MTLVQVTQGWAQARPTASLLTFLDGEGAEASLTRGELDGRARAIAAALLARGLAGHRVLLLYVPGLEFVSALLGCLYAGVVAVPAYPPDPSRLPRTLPRLQAIVADCAPSLVLTTRSILAMTPFLFGAAPDLAPLPWAASDEWERGEGGADLPRPGDEDLAFLQYTSGSTAAPRGVMISHRNLSANLRQLAEARRGGEHTTIVSWLPFYHDLGLIGAILFPLFIGGRTILSSPLDFLKRPLRWLEAMHRFRADTSAAPNFALDLCARKIAPGDLSGLDLSRWTMALIGAEPLQRRTLDGFCALLAPTGFHPHAIFQGYGLAEGVLASACGSLDEPFRSERFDAAALREGRVAAAPPDEEGGRTLVSCGRPMSGQRIEIVDPIGRRRCAPDQVGEIWIAGDNVARGYFGRDEETARVFGARLEGGEGPFLRTGDLGFFSGGELYVAGRAKDLIIIRGKNHHPQDLEQTVDGCHALLRPGCSAAFAVDDAAGERLVIAAEVDARGLPAGAAQEGALGEIVAAIRGAISRQHGLLTQSIALLRPGQLQKTSSGKLMRHACRADWLAGRLAELTRSSVAPQGEEEQAEAEAPLGGGEERAVLRWLRARLCRLLGAEPALIGDATPFAELGIDSRQAVGLVGELEAALGRKLPATLLYDHPSLGALARFLSSAPAAPPSPAVAVAATEGRRPASGARYRRPERRHSPTESRIAIIGAGAAGLTAAWELARLGYRHITILEKDEDVGGKVCTAVHRGHPYEFGQMFFTGDYKEARRLLGELGLELAPNPMISRRMDALSGRLVTTNVFDSHVWLQKVLRLGGLDEQGGWRGPAPDPTDWSEPVGSFLRRHDLWPMPAGILTCWTVLGYGYPTDDVPAWYLIVYARVLRSLSLEGVAMLPGGSQRLWRAMAERLQRQHGVELVHGAEIRGVRREANRVTLSLGAGGERAFDALILACPPDAAAALLEPAAPERAALQRFRSYDYVCTSYEARHGGSLGQITFDDSIPVDSVGALLCLGHHPQVDMVMLAQYGSPPGQHDVLSAAELDARARRGMEDLGIAVGAPILQRRWRMFHHLGPADLRRGVLRQLEARQGAGEVYLAGSYLSFETIEHTIEHTRELVEHFFAPRAAEAESGDEPIAIIGMGCRFPGGADGPEAFWRLLRDGADAVSELPGGAGADRFDAKACYAEDPTRPGRSVSRWGGLLGDVDRFDSEFFGLSPKEARSLDPQGRLLLEVSWEALEDAGLAPAQLQGSATGVYMGLSGVEYQGRTVAEKEGIDAYSLLNTMHSTVVGRLSYWLGLQGPNLAIDTACSSSLVALHLACQALRAGECSLALCGGANVLLSAAGMIAFSKLGILSPTGRCRTFSEQADGIVRAEGCGVLVLKRLRDATRDGDEVLAVVRGSAVNQDGRSNGLAAPSGPAQQQVIRRALQQAGVAPRDIDYVECHGTGTALGDPIEVQALARELAPGRGAEEPVLLGSVKTNIGHAEAAAGAAGLIKTVLALRHRRLPRTLHQGAPSSRIPWRELPVAVVAEERDWPERGRPRRAGVSSFGVSGTNAHVVLEEAPPAQRGDAPRGDEAQRSDEAQRGADPQRGADAAPEPRAVPLLISGQSERALRAQAARLREHLAQRPQLGLAPLAWSLATRRSHLAQRAAVIARDGHELAGALRALEAGERSDAVLVGRARSGGQLALLFTGQGSQRAAMGRALYAASPPFRAALDELCERFSRALPRRLGDVMFADEGSPLAPLLHETQYTQPALFALEVALYRHCEHFGLRPDLLLGHSIGELAAVHVADALSADDACALVAARGRLMQALPPGGAMVAVEAGEAELAELLHGRDHELSIAAINGPQACVLSGDEAAALAVAEQLAARGRRVARLDVSHAFHSPRMEPALRELRRVAEGTRPRAPRIPVLSSLTGKALRAEDLSAPDYWARQARGAVRFYDGLRLARTQGVTAYLELGPRGVLCAMAAAAGHDPAALFLPLLGAGEAEPEAALRALCALHVRGHELNWASGLAPLSGPRVPLPTYAFLRERHFIAPASMDRGRSIAPPADPGPGPDEDAARAVDRAQGAGPGAAERGAAAPAPAPTEIEGGAPRVALRGTAPIRPSGFLRPGRWLLLADGLGLANRVETGLSDRGATVVRVEADASAACSASWHTLDPGDRDAIARMLARVAAQRQGLRGVVLLWGLPQPAELRGDGAAQALAAQRAFAAVVHTAQALAALPLPSPPRLYLVTQAAQGAGLGGAPRFEQALLWGLGGALAAQLPRLRVQQLDVTDPCSAAEADALTRELLADTEEPRVVLRGAERLVERLEREEAEASGDERLIGEVLSLPPPQAAARLVAQLRGHLGALLQGDAAALSEDVPLRDLGIDSLTGLGLLGALQRELGVRLPLHALSPDLTLSGLAEQLLSRLFNRRHNA